MKKPKQEHFAHIIHDYDDLAELLKLGWRVVSMVRYDDYNAILVVVE